MAKHAKLASVAAAAALSLMLSAPAYAAISDTGSNGSYEGTLDVGSNFNADTVITANVSTPDAKVISVTVPSTMAIPIATKNENGITVFDDAKKFPIKASITNNAKSDVSVKAEVSKVAESPASAGGALLSTMVNLSLAGDDDVLLAQGDYVSANVLASSLAPNASREITLSAAAKSPNQEVEDGAYTLTATIKVTAL